ncbi:MAG: hypothetical protein ACPGQL_05260 [Thermoplasmatota archaeon]
MRSLSLLMVAALLLPAAAVTAVPAPALYFLDDGATPIIDDGVLSVEQPTGNETRTRLVLPAAEAVLQVRFVSPAGEERPNLLRGPLFVGLWTGESVVLNGNLTASIGIMEGETFKPLGNASVALDLNQSDAPDPLALIPPDPTDPQGAAFHVLAQVLPLLFKPPTLLNLGIVDLEVPEGSQVAVQFRLDPGSSALPIPTAAFAQVQYGAILTPSFVFIPWYEPDPPRPDPPAPVTPPPTTPDDDDGGDNGGTGGQDTDEGDGDGEDSPGASAVIIAVGLLAAVAVARRRL